MRIAVKTTLFFCCAILTASLSLAQTIPQQTIGTLEPIVNAGTATRDQQLDLARAYIQVGRFYEASTLAKQVLDAKANDADAAALRDQAVAGLHTAAEQKVSAAQANANRQGATGEDRLALANADFEAGDYRAASDVYAKLPASVMSRDTRLRQAHALAWSSQLDAAERVYSQLIAQQDSPDLELEYGRLLSWMGASHASTETLRSVYQQNQTEDTAIALANAQAWSGHREEAIQLLSDFTAAHPGSAKADQLLVQLRTSPDLAIERVDRMIAADPYNLALHMQKAHLLYDAGRYAEAGSTLKFVRQNAKQPVEGLDQLQTQAEQRRREEIAKLDERRKAMESSTNVSAGMTSSSTSGSDVVGLAKAYAGLGGYKQAEALYGQYLKMHPDDTQARIEYARVLSWDSRYSSANRQYEILLRDNPDRADLRYEYAQNLSYQSDFVDAVHVLNQLTDVSSNPRARLYTDVPAKAYFSRGQIYRWYGWTDTAIADQNRSLQMDPTNSLARQELELSRLRRPASTLGGTYSDAKDSTGFELRRLDFDGQHWVNPRTAVEGSVGRHEFLYQRDDVFATALSGGGRYRFQDRWTARARIGANIYDNGIGTRPFWNAGVDWLPSIQSRMAFDYNHYDIIYDVFDIASLTPASPIPNASRPLDIDDFRGMGTYYTGGFWSFLGDASYGFISDSNKRAAAHGLASFRLFKEPFVAVKGEGRWLSYDRRTSLYWSPTDYRSAALVLQVGQDRKNYFWTVEGKAGRAWEQSGIPGVAQRSSDIRSVVATVTVPVSQIFDIVGSYGYGKSGRYGAVFNANPGDFTNYWQRNFYVGVRLHRLFANGESRPQDRYYYDNRVLTGSPVLPPVGETH